MGSPSPLRTKHITVSATCRLRDSNQRPQNKHAKLGEEAPPLRWCNRHVGGFFQTSRPRQVQHSSPRRDKGPRKLGHLRNKNKKIGAGRRDDEGNAGGNRSAWRTACGREASPQNNSEPKGNITSLVWTQRADLRWYGKGRHSRNTSRKTSNQHTRCDPKQNGRDEHIYYVHVIQADIRWIFSYTAATADREAGHPCFQRRLTRS